jgi:hypothetical protein
MNFLNAEAVAVALVLDADIRIVASSPILREATAALGIDLRVVAV